MKQRTKGLFTDSVELLKDPGTRYKEDKASLLGANPELLRLLQRKEKLEFKKIKEKREQKVLQD